MAGNEFDRRFEAHRRSIERTRAATSIVAMLISLAIISVVTWLIIHPSLIGAWFGHLASGFRSVR